MDNYRYKSERKSTYNSVCGNNYIENHLEGFKNRKDPYV